MIQYIETKIQCIEDIMINTVYRGDKDPVYRGDNDSIYRGDNDSIHRRQ